MGRFLLDGEFLPVFTVFSGFLRCSQSGYRILNETTMREMHVHLYTTQEMASPSAVALASALRPRRWRVDARAEARGAEPLCRA